MKTKWRDTHRGKRKWKKWERKYINYWNIIKRSQGKRARQRPDSHEYLTTTTTNGEEGHPQSYDRQCDAWPHTRQDIDRPRPEWRITRQQEGEGERGRWGRVLPWGAQITQRCSSWWWWWKWIVHPPPPILIAGWHTEGRSSQAEDAVHAAIHHSVEHLISLFGPGPRRLAAHHIKDNSVLKGIKVMCQLLQLDKWVNYEQQLPPPSWNANRCAAASLLYAPFGTVITGYRWRLLTIMKCHIKHIQICQRELSNMSRNWRRLEPIRTSSGPRPDFPWSGRICEIFARRPKL